MNNNNMGEWVHAKTRELVPGEAWPLMGPTDEPAIFFLANSLLRKAKDDDGTPVLLRARLRRGVHGATEHQERLILLWESRDAQGHNGRRYVSEYVAQFENDKEDIRG